MTRRVRVLATLGLVAGLLTILMVWRTARNHEFTSVSPLVPTPVSPLPVVVSPLAVPTTTRADSIQSFPPTARPPVTTATLDAIRAMRPKATLPSSPSGSALPYISPATWRDWALRILAAAGVVAYIGLRLRRTQ